MKLHPCKKCRTAAHLHRRPGRVIIRCQAGCLRCVQRSTLRLGEKLTIARAIETWNRRNPVLSLSKGRNP